MRDEYQIITGKVPEQNIVSWLYCEFGKILLMKTIK